MHASNEMCINTEADKLPDDFNVGTCATLCHYVYHDPDDPGVLPANIKPLLKSAVFTCSIPDNYGGKNYYSFHAELLVDQDQLDKTQTGVFFIAFRGTSTNKEDLFPDLFQDFNITMGAVPPYFKKGAIPFIDEVKQYIRINYRYLSPDKIFYLYTGHSLGALLAELSYCYNLIILDDTRFNKCVSFESPGSLALLNKLMSDGTIPPTASHLAPRSLLALVADVNFINTAAKHIGTLWKCDIPYTYTESKHLPQLWSYFWDFTVHNQHLIKGFIQHCSTAHKIEKFWPWGFKSAYNNYVTYSERPAYWDRFMALYWDKHPQEQIAFHHDYDRFTKTFKSVYLKGASLAVSTRPSVFFQNPDRFFVEDSENAINKDKFFASLSPNPQVIIEQPYSTEVVQEKNNALAKPIDIKLSQHSTYLFNPVNNPIVQQLREAVINGDSKQAAYLLQFQGARVNDSSQLKGNSLLHLAVGLGHASMVDLLLSSGIEVDKVNTMGNTALHLAATHCHESYGLELVKSLILAHANLAKTNYIGQTAWDIIFAKQPANIATYAKLFEQDLVDAQANSIELKPTI